MIRATIVFAASALVALAGPATATEIPRANVNADCTLIVPPNPLSATGLSTPFRLTATNPKMGPCNEANTAQSAFVEASVIDTDTGAISVYHPLVIDNQTQPAVPPVVPKLPANSVVGLWFGFNGNNLTLRMQGNGDQGQGNPNCVNGLATNQGVSIFGQFAYCNGPAFFRAANAAISAGKLTVPPLGMASDGMPCPTTRDFSVVDQDQSDNVDTQYLLTFRGQLAQKNAANYNSLEVSSVLNNGSDNGLLNNFIQPALGCKSFTAPDLGDNGAPSHSLALNELQATLQAEPVALVPMNDPMTLVNNNQSVQKTNLYRAGVNQPMINPNVETPRAYCAALGGNNGGRRVSVTDRPYTTGKTAPLPAANAPQAADLFAFLKNRLNTSNVNLKCVPGNGGGNNGGGNNGGGNNNCGGHNNAVTNNGGGNNGGGNNGGKPVCCANPGGNNGGGNNGNGNNAVANSDAIANNGGGNNGGGNNGGAPSCCPSNGGNSNANNGGGNNGGGNNGGGNNGGLPCCVVPGGNSGGGNNNAEATNRGGGNNNCGNNGGGNNNAGAANPSNGGGYQGGGHY
ncbi:MAG: hypothetical protein JOZ47_23665 [Kutzneria sp.]|nr:hypothetical protein [Kutzneria sp.]